MAHFILRKAVEILGRWNLDDLPEVVSFGSHENDTIRLKGEKVSDSHFKLKKTAEGGLTVSDERDRSVQSISGTYVNGRLITAETPFQPGDQVKFGDYCIELERSGDEVVQEDGPTGYLLGIFGPYSGIRYVLDKNETKLGRDTTFNDILLRCVNPGAKEEKVDQTISRRLLSFRRKHPDYYVSLFPESHTKVRINNQEMSPDEEHRLISGDEIEILSTKSSIFRFMLEGDMVLTPPRKSGDFFIRHLRGLLMGTALTAVFICGIQFARFFHSRSLIAQLPPINGLVRPMKTWEPWISGESINTEDVDSSAFLENDYASSPAIGDIDGKDDIEIVAADQSGNVTAFDCRSKKTLWNGPSKYRAHQPFPIVLDDLNGDGREEILFVTSDSRLCVLDGGSGLSVSKWNEFIGGSLAGPPIVKDINGDGYLDVAVTTEQGVLHVGFNRPSQVEWKQFNLGYELSSPPIFIQSKKGIPSLWVGSNDGNLLSIDMRTLQIEVAGSVNESLNQALGKWGERNSIASPLATGKVGPNAEIVACVTREARVVAYDPNEGERKWFEAGISQSGRKPRHTGGPIMADLDKDGYLDVLVAFPGGMIKAYKGGAVGDPINPNVCLWTFKSDTLERFNAVPAMGDLNKDGVPDVVIGGTSGRLYIINGATGLLIWQGRITEIPIRSSVLLGDVDGDNSVEILCMNAFNDVFKIGTNSKILKNKIIWSQQGGYPDGNAVLTDVPPSVAKYNVRLAFLFLVAAICLGGALLFRKQQAARVSKSYRPYCQPQ